MKIIEPKVMHPIPQPSGKLLITKWRTKNYERLASSGNQMGVEKEPECP